MSAECDDCGKERDLFIVFAKDGQFFAVCADCIKKSDNVCPDNLIKRCI